MRPKGVAALFLAPEVAPLMRPGGNGDGRKVTAHRVMVAKLRRELRSRITCEAYTADLCLVHTISRSKTGRCEPRAPTVANVLREKSVLSGPETQK